MLTPPQKKTLSQKYTHTHTIEIIMKERSAIAQRESHSDTPKCQNVDDVPEKGRKGLNDEEGDENGHSATHAGGTRLEEQVEGQDE